MVRTSVRARGLLPCLLLAGVSVAGCSAPTPEPAPTSSVPPGIAEPSGPNDVDTDLPQPQASPTWDAGARAGAEQAATAAMTVFTGHDRDAEAWWQRLRPYLSTQAGADYAGTDPAQVPARTITGPAALVDDTSAYLAGVEVPTDAGTYQVLLSRTGASTPWLVERLAPPGEQGSW